MTKTNNEMKLKAVEIFQGIQVLERYGSIIKAQDNLIYELTCSFDAIDNDNPKAETLKKSIEDLMNLNALLLEGFSEKITSLEELADNLSIGLMKE